ncbi:hypothetical protein C0993_002557 [Termitomyces sp. T159_Od127]|nr:hypothetical protein C0993_002557 [Termitomyces sp. T159_Od127]
MQSLPRIIRHTLGTNRISPQALLFARTMASHKQQTLIQAIKHDHQEINDYYDQFVKASGNIDAQERWARQLSWEVARHAVGEEIVVYPLMEQCLGEKGAKLADKDRADHMAVKKQLYDLESMTVGSKNHANLLESIMADLRHHIADEEKNDLPDLESALGEDGSLDAASRFARTKQFAPTRAHPSAPDKPPFENLAGFLAAPLDKLKDVFSKFPTEEMKANMK